MSGPDSDRIHFDVGLGKFGFNPDIFSTRRIVIGPCVTFIGFLLMAFAILIKPSK